MSNFKPTQLIRNKTKILEWAKKRNRLPKRTSVFKGERKLAQLMENYLSIAAPQFDPFFREYVYGLYPRRSQIKRQHDKKLRVKELLNFVKLHGRSPSYKVDSERLLGRTLDNYARPSGVLYDPKVEKALRRHDKCFVSGIKFIYRQSINEALGNKLLKKEVIK